MGGFSLLGFEQCVLTCVGSVLLRFCLGFKYYCFGHPLGDVVEVSSSSYNLSIFSLKASSQRDEGAGAAPRKSSSVSIGDLSPEIDSLREA
jgi:hypothetical protein